MPKSIESLVSFSAGELSPSIRSRVDQAKYRAGCLQLRNMLPLKSGPATRRPGTQYIAPTKVIAGGNYCARLEDFEFSVNTTFMLEWGHNYVRFYSNGFQVNVSSAPTWVTGTTYLPGSYAESAINGEVYYTAAGDPASSIDPLNNPLWVQQNILECPTPYSALAGSGPVSSTEVFQLQFGAINDVIYVNHPNHPRAKLTRFSDTDWQYQVVQDLTPALLDQNATDTTIAASSASGTTTLTASAPAWATATYYDVGSSVLKNSNIYECEIPHVSGTFLTDLQSGRWVETPIFLPGHVGSYWELSYLRASAYVEYDGTAASGFAAGISPSITAFGAWEVHTYGVWSADIQIQASSNGGITWQTVRSVTGRNDRNVDITGTADQAQLYQIVVSNVSVPPTPGTTNPRIVFECVDAFLNGIVQITGVTDAYHATATVVTQLTVADAWISGFAYSAGDRAGYSGVNYLALNNVTSSTNPSADPTNWSADGWPTIYWSEGAWSGVRGYPAAITIFEQRVWCGFSAYEPQRMWGTQIDDIENFDLGDGTLATDGIAFDLDAVGDGALLWMQSQDALFVGMVQSEWVVGASDNTSISPTNISAHRQSRWGSNQNIPAMVVGDALLFVQRQGFSLRQMLFSINTQKYMSQDLTALSDQIFNGGAIQTAYQKQGNKNGFVWATTANGELVALTYELDQEVFGWSRHYTGLGIDAGFESVACIQGKGTNDDEVWVVVNRTIGGIAQRFVERLNPINWQTLISQPGQSPGYGPNKNQAFYVDSGITIVGPTTNVFRGLTWLQNRTVSVCINAQDYGTFPVTGPLSQVTVSSYTPTVGNTDVVQIGLPFTSTVQPMNLDVDVHTGVTQGLKKKVTGLFLSLLNTLACKVTDGSFRSIVNAGSFILGQTYTIVSLGSTDFTQVGAAANVPGLTFVATGAGTGNGTAGNAPRIFELGFRDTANPLLDPQLFNDIYECKQFSGDYGYDVPVIMYTDGPLPLTVAGVAIAYNPAGRP